MSEGPLGMSWGVWAMGAVAFILWKRTNSAASQSIVAPLAPLAPTVAAAPVVMPMPVPVAGSAAPPSIPGFVVWGANPDGTPLYSQMQGTNPAGDPIWGPIYTLEQAMAVVAAGAATTPMSGLHSFGSYGRNWWE